MAKTIVMATATIEEEEESESEVEPDAEEDDAAVVKEPAANTQLFDQDVNQDEDRDNVVVGYAGKTMVDAAPLACDGWNNKSIDWRYYTHQIEPTVAGHA